MMKRLAFLILLLAPIGGAQYMRADSTTDSTGNNPNVRRTAIASSFVDPLTSDASSDLPLAGGTLSGSLTLAAPSVAALRATTKQFTDKATTISVRDVGAYGDAIELTDVALSNGNTTLISASASFVPGDVGKSFACIAGLTGYPLISSVTDSHHVVLASAATANESSLMCDYGHDDTVAFQNATRSTGSYPSTRVNVYVPPATYLVHSNAIAVRKGDALIGSGDNGSSLISYDSGNFIIQMGTNAAGSIDPGGLVPVVRNLYLQGPNATNGIAANSNGFTVDHNWMQVNIGIQATGTDGLITGNTCDLCAVFVSIVGTGTTDYTSTHSIIVQQNRTFAPKYACFEVQGSYDLTIDSNYCNYAFQYGVLFQNPSYNNHRIKISNNQFTTSTNSSFYSATQQHIYIGAPVYGLQISNNTFARAINADIYNGANVFDGQINGNVFEDSQAPNGSIQIQSSNWTINGNTFINGFSSGINDIDGVINAQGNIFSNLFQGGTPSHAYDNAAIHLTSAATAGSVIAGNSTTDTTYYVLGQSGGAVNTTSFGNLSGFSSGDVYDFGNGPFNSCDERTTAPGGPTASTCPAKAFSTNAGQSWTSGSGAPSGSCASGSLYTNNSGDASTTLYVCVSSAWRPVRIP
jgi:hypothetical protein